MKVCVRNKKSILGPRQDIVEEKSEKILFQNGLYRSERVDTLRKSFILSLAGEEVIESKARLSVWTFRASEW